MDLDTHSFHAYSVGRQGTMQHPQIVHGVQRDGVDLEVDYKVKKVTDKFSECLHIVVNEPSLALYRLQEHVRRSLPHLSQCKTDLAALQQEVQGKCYDVDYATRTVDGMKASVRPFTSINTLLKSAVVTKQHLNHRASDRWEVLEGGGGTGGGGGASKRSSIHGTPRRPLSQVKE
ncbi:BLOC-1-related complex subunit 8-like isoform X1 [Lytechinus variegatus]|uniref:BLOC-1-related complex subunit 8-like isoform X1 n=1 Tax=Lytechinus variegatus TaxID=7654 RepID=UPI001BB183A3|nr:BLOC-1-related complex subunit 8-like isoform X1 [Lytechinus variegatus]